MPREPLHLPFSLTDIGNAAKHFWKWAEGARIFTFSGALGAGKTTFIHALCDLLGVKDAVSSPTYALINEYRFAAEGGEHTICHMDWYRLRSTDEAVDAGMEALLGNSQAFCFIEWPEKAPELLRGSPHISIRLEHTGEWERMLTAEVL